MAAIKAKSKINSQFVTRVEEVFSLHGDTIQAFTMELVPYTLKELFEPAKTWPQQPDQLNFNQIRYLVCCILRGI